MKTRQSEDNAGVVVFLIIIIIKFVADNMYRKRCCFAVMLKVQV